MKAWLFIPVILVLGTLGIYMLWPGEPALSSNCKIDSLVLYKSEQKMHAYCKGNVAKTYIVSLGMNTTGRKEIEGDRKTPEGLYYIHDKNPNSGYHKNLGISYPNEADILHAKKLGKPPGGDIKIHGLMNGLGFVARLHRLMNWTLGCIAVTNEEVDELYHALPIGTAIHIYP